MHINTSFFTCTLQNVVGKITKKYEAEAQILPGHTSFGKKKTLHSPYLLMRPPDFN